MNLQAYISHIEELSGENALSPTAKPLSGGDINQAFAIQFSPTKKYFLKLNSIEYVDMFQQESINIHTINQTGLIKVPAALDFGELEGQSFLILEYIELHNRGNEYQLGQQLAALHRYDASALSFHTFGFYSDNYIGTSQQKNAAKDQWRDFWWSQRIEPQLKLARDQGYRLFKSSNTEFEKAMQELLVSHKPQNSLLHGDLWSGNKAF